MNHASAFPNRHLAVYGLFLLGGDTKRIHTEDIALKCFELFPHSFSWVRHTQYPDKDIVRIALCDARKAKYGALVEGRAGRSHGLADKTKYKTTGDGWMLTASGVQWIKENKHLFEQFALSGQAKEHRQKVLRELKRIKEHVLFSQYMDSPQRFYPAIGAVADLLRCRVDAEDEIWQKRFESIESKAHVSEQSDVLEFVNLCREAYIKQR